MIARCLFGLAFIAAALGATLARAQTPESPLREITLAGPAASRGAEFSSLAWHSEELLLIPQNPQPRSVVYALDRAAIQAYLAASNPLPLELRIVPLLGPDLQQALPGFDGIEAVAVRGEQIFALIEAHAPGAGSGQMRGLLARGAIAPAGITFELDRVAVLPAQVDDARNIAYESLVLAGDVLIALYETNRHAAPRALVFDLDLNLLAEVAFPAVDYRLTDATPAQDGVFWAANVGFVRSESEPLAVRFGLGETHQRSPQIERLVMFTIAEGYRIALADRPPVYLALSDPVMRNWEGLTRWDDRSFLIITDEWPRTVFGWVPGAAIP